MEQRPRGQRTVVLFALLGITVLAALLWVARETILAAWHIHRLETASPLERLDGARRLGQLRHPSAALPLARCLRAEDQKLRVAAASALAELGRQAAPAAPHLAEALIVPYATDVANQGQERMEWTELPEIARALRSIGPLAIPHTIHAMLEHERIGSSTVYRKMPEGILVALAPASVGQLMPLLGSDERRVHRPAASALRAIGVSAGPALTARSAARRPANRPAPSTSSSASPRTRSTTIPPGRWTSRRSSRTIRAALPCSPARRRR